MISLQDIGVQFGGDLLFSELSFMLNKGDRVGLVGKNGAGKSTLLKLIYHQTGFSTGNISVQKEKRIGYLSQDIDFESGNTVVEEAEKAFVEINRLQSNLAAIQIELNQRTDYESEYYLELINKSVAYEDELTILGAYSLHANIEKVLYGLGFKNEDLSKKTETFSGGWRMRIELAKVLLSKPDVLLLDEPTNHLDIESIVWLEQFLKNYTGAILLVSHDKTFLDQVSNRTIEIANHQIYDYKAPYSKYLILRKERIEQQLAVYKNQEKEIKHTQKLIDKFRYKANKAAFAQSLIKKLERMDKVEVDTMSVKKMAFTFPESDPSGKVVLEMSQLSKSYEEKLVLNNVELQINRGDRYALVGQNGQGKSTLIKCIAKQVSFQGTIELGHRVQMSYFAQNQAELLDPEQSVLELIERSADDTLRPRSRDMLGSFLFSNDDVDKKIKVLSGGERSRLALCEMLLQSSNLLILDEPTNHLDINSKEVLKEALKSYKGTLLIVSHDRDFLDGLTNMVLEFKDGLVKPHIGSVSEYLNYRKIESMRDLEKKTNIVKVSQPKQLDKYARKALEKSIKKCSNQLSKIVRKIKELESNIAASDLKLSNPVEFEKLMDDHDFFKSYEDSKDMLDKAMEEWAVLEDELEQLMSQR